MAVSYLQKTRPKTFVPCACGRLFKGLNGFKQHMHWVDYWNMARREWGQELDKSHGVEKLSKQEGDNK